MFCLFLGDFIIVFLIRVSFRYEKLNSITAHLFSRALTALGSFFILSSSCSAESLEPELWIFTHFALERSKQQEIFLTLHGRGSDEDSLSLYQIQPRYAAPLNEWLWGALNYSFLGIRRSGATVDNEDLIANQHRLEAEIQIRLLLSEGIRYVGRNRLEHLLSDTFNEVSNRLRHRSQFLLPSLLPSIGTVVSQIELFYDFNTNRINQTRSAPLGLRLNLDRWMIQAQPMIIHLYQPETGWNTRLVGNIELTYEF